MKMTIFLTLIFSIIAFSGCQTASTTTVTNSTTATDSAAQTEIKQISIAEAKDATSGKNQQFIDVRTPEEYAGGHAPSTALFPLDSLEKDLAKLDKTKPVYVICQTGRRSQKGAEILHKAGFTEVYNIKGGTGAWIEAGFPTEK